MVKKWKPTKAQQKVIDYMRKTGRKLATSTTYSGGVRMIGYEKVNDGRAVSTATVYRLMKEGVLVRVGGENERWYERIYRLSDEWGEAQQNGK